MLFLTVNPSTPLGTHSGPQISARSGHTSLGNAVHSPAQFGSTTPNQSFCCAAPVATVPPAQKLLHCYLTHASAPTAGTSISGPLQCAVHEFREWSVVTRCCSWERADAPAVH